MTQDPAAEVERRIAQLMVPFLNEAYERGYQRGREDAAKIVEALVPATQDWGDTVIAERLEEAAQRIRSLPQPEGKGT